MAARSSHAPADDSIFLGTVNLGAGMIHHPPLSAVTRHLRFLRAPPDGDAAFVIGFHQSCFHVGMFPLPATLVKLSNWYLFMSPLELFFKDNSIFSS